MPTDCEISEMALVEMRFGAQFPKVIPSDSLGPMHSSSSSNIHSNVVLVIAKIVDHIYR